MTLSLRDSANPAKTVNNADNGGYGRFAEFYDALMSDFDYPSLAAYYDSLIRKSGVEGGLLLDLACGTGKLSVLMSERGWDVIGVDSSVEMLSNAELREKVSYICQNMTELDLYGTIDAAICSLDGLNHLSGEKSLRKALEKVSLFMNPGGVFVFDMNTLYKHETILGDNIFVKESDGVYCVWRNAYQGDGEVDINLDIFAEDGNGGYVRFYEEIREKAYPEEEVKILCEQAGFEVTDILDFNTQADSPSKIMAIHNEKAVFVCKKNPV